MLDDWEEFTLLIRMTKNARKPFKMRGENWKGPWTRPCRAKRRFILAPGNWERNWMHLTRFQKQSMVVSWNLMNPQGNEWNLPYVKDTKMTLQAKVSLRWSSTIWFTNLSPCHKRWKFRMQKQQWTRNRRSSKRSQQGNWRKSRARGGHSRSTKRQKESPFCYIYGHMSPQKRGVRTQITKV